MQVDVLKRTGKDRERGNQSLLDEELDSDCSSHFEQQINKWIELNLTSYFTAFVRDVGSKAQSLPLLLHNKEVLIHIILSLSI